VGGVVALRLAFLFAAWDAALACLKTTPFVRGETVLLHRPDRAVEEWVVLDYDSGTKAVSLQRSVRVRSQSLVKGYVAQRDAVARRTPQLLTDPAWKRALMTLGTRGPCGKHLVRV